MVGSFGVICRSKVAELVPIGNPIWGWRGPGGGGILKISQLGRKHQAALFVDKKKKSKIVRLEIQGGHHGGLLATW